MFAITERFLLTSAMEWKGHHLRYLMFHWFTAAPSRLSAVSFAAKVQQISVLTLVLGGMAFFILVFGIENIPRYPVFHGILAVN